MPIIEVTGDVLSSASQTLLCTTNCNGAMGAGIALAFKRAYPSIFKRYYKLHTDGRLHVNRLFVGVPDEDPNKLILLFPTKDKWWDDSKLEWIEANLQTLANRFEEFGITTLAMPYLGTRNGNLLADDVKPLIFKYLDPLPIRIELYKPWQPRT